MTQICKNSSFEIEDLGVQEQWVYDIEVDGVHNFFANGILVHNSLYLNFDPLIKKLGYEDKSDVQKVDFLDQIHKKKLGPLLQKWTDELKEYFQSYENRMFFAREKITKSGIWVAKKRYALAVYDDEGVRYSEPKVKVTGLESIRSSTAGFAIKWLDNAYKVALLDDEKALQKYVGSRKEEFLKLPVEDYAWPRGVSEIDKWIDENGLPGSGCPIHVRAVIVHNTLREKHNLLQINEIMPGSKVKFIKLKVPNPAKSHVVAFDGAFPEEFGLNKYIDKDTMFEEGFIKPLQNMLNSMGWQAEKIETLDDFFC